MNALRLYAAPLMLLAWAVLLAFLDDAAVQLVLVRLVTVAVALTVSIRELSGRRHGRGP